jgi:translation initiation factor 1
MEICPKCGLPEQACVCEQIVKSSQRIKVTTDRKRYGKIVTVVTGFGEGIDVKKIAKALKNELACGGTHKNNVIELQGDHRSKMKGLLVELGFEENSIDYA